MIPPPLEDDTEDELKLRKHDDFAYQRVTTSEANEIIEFNANDEFYDADETYDMNLICSSL